MFKTATLDKIAMSLSAVCLVHCLMAPVLLTLVPIVSSSLLVNDAIFHQLILWLILPTSGIALLLGCRKHRLFSIAACGILGISILVVVAFFGHNLFGITGEKIATSAGGLILAASHFLNFNACRSVPCDDVNCSSNHHH